MPNEIQPDMNDPKVQEALKQLIIKRMKVRLDQSLALQNRTKEINDMIRRGRM